MSARGHLSLMLFFGSMAAAAALLAMIFTSPEGIGPIGVTIWFLILLGSLATLAAGGLFYLKKHSPRIQNTEEKLLEHSWRQGWLIGGALVAVLALSSLGQLTLRDVGIIAGLAILLEVFLRTRV